MIGRAAIISLVFFAEIGAAVGVGRAQTVQAAPTPSGQPVPRFESLRFDDVNGRAGPSIDHPIEWRYRRAGLPLEVIAETQSWRRVRDPDGDQVWVHRRTLSARRTVSPVSARASVHARPDETAPVKAWLATGAIADVERCERNWCLLAVQGLRGWTPQAGLWGLYPGETLGED